MEIPGFLKDRMVHLFDHMDAAYDRAAGQSGFVCRGCIDNCCRTRFYHHTLLELLYLRTGMAQLSPRQQDHLKKKAIAADVQAADLQRHHAVVRVMCPLNKDGRCLLYVYRPMICRLHGIPHALRRPDGQIQSGPGCDDYYAQCGKSKGILLDRTPLYTAMAQLEQQLRKALDFNLKIKMTIAEMIGYNRFRL